MSSLGGLLQKLDPKCGLIEVDPAVESGVPGFGQPWHAEAFGMSLALSHASLFFWAEWVEIFSEEIRTHPQHADEGSETAYYRQWLAALEAILVKHAALTSEEIAEAMEHWRRSYLNTPHGKPVAFSREWENTPEREGRGHDDHRLHDHGHDPDHAWLRARQPVAISPPVAVKKT